MKAGTVIPGYFEPSITTNAGRWDTTAPDALVAWTKGSYANLSIGKPSHYRVGLVPFFGKMGENSL